MKAILNSLLAAIVGGIVATGMQLAAIGNHPDPATCLKGLDPIALTQGKEVPGDSAISVVRGRYRYLFTNAENKSTFEKQPERYAIQLGGGCGRMGPLSGVGSPDRFLVHDSRIYIFASDQCMNGFMSAPEKHVESDDPPPTGSDSGIQRGKELVELAVVGFGGASKVDAVASLELKKVRIYQADGKDQEQATFTRVVFPDRFRLDDIWHSGSASDFVRGESGYRLGNDGAWPMDEIVRRELIKSFRHNPLVLLKARSSPNFRAVSAGLGKVGDQDVEWLAIGLDGATSTLGIHSTSGQVLSIRYRGRAPAAIGVVTRTFSDFRDVDGLKLPFAVSTGYNETPTGAPQPFTAITVNPKFDARLFASPD